jgi:hypothetical protein
MHVTEMTAGQLDLSKKKKEKSDITICFMHSSTYGFGKYKSSKENFKVNVTNSRLLHHEM